MSATCAQAEILAGAIALNEATDGERDAYRRHLAGCTRCIESFGGEREIERTMSVVTAGRDSETWEPDGRLAGRARVRMSRLPALRWTVTAAIVAAGAYAALLAGWQHPALRHTATLALAPVVHTTPAIRRQERLIAHLVWRSTPRVRLIVVHNVVTLRRPRTASPVPATRPAVTAHPSSRRRITAGRQAPLAVGVADADFTARPSDRDRSSVSSLRTAAGAAPAQRAESLAVVASSVIIHEVFPLGGDTAIAPRPAPIAYSENAEGTTAFEVSVDERGLPVKCTISKSSGYLVLDEAVCRAAMRARYSPRTIDGRPVMGVYRDAFTFRRSEDQ